MLICTGVLSCVLNVPDISLDIIYISIKSFTKYVHVTNGTSSGTKRGQATILSLKNKNASIYIIKKAFCENTFLSHDQT